MSAVSQVSICNLALGWLGQSPIISLDDPSNSAQLCKANYDVLRDAVLEEGEWQFAFAQKALPASTTVPVIGDGKYFTIPSDMVRLLRCDDGSQTFRIQWRREGRFIRAEVDVLYIDYIFREEDPVRFTPGFSQALAGRIAAELAMPITNSATMQGTMWKLYGSKVRSALNLDNMASRQQKIRSDALTRVR
jgi:hypothetical protein